MTENSQRPWKDDRVHRRILTTEEIYFKGRRYHDPELTSQLVRDLAYLCPSKSARSKFEVMVEIAIGRDKEDQEHADPSFIKVRNPRSGEYVDLPNVWRERLGDILPGEQLLDYVARSVRAQPRLA